MAHAPGTVTRPAGAYFHKRVDLPARITPQEEESVVRFAAVKSLNGRDFRDITDALGLTHVVDRLTLERRERSDDA